MDRSPNSKDLPHSPRTKENSFIGINIGAVSVNVVWQDTTGVLHSKKKSHLGNPQGILKEILSEGGIRPLDGHVQYTNAHQHYYQVSGTFGEISENLAIERALQEQDTHYNAILSLGGEAFILYVLDENNHIVNILSQDKCAAGSGEFFLQQIERLNLTLKEAIDLAEKGSIIQIASRCSVHCKSDVTHKLNRGEASLEDILASLLSNMTKKGVRMIKQAQVPISSLLLIGGLTLNRVVVQQLKSRIPDVNITIHPYSHVFEAYGTMLLARDLPEKQSPQLLVKKSFSLLPPLSGAAPLVIEMDNSRKEDLLLSPEIASSNANGTVSRILGVDVGSTTTKAVLIDGKTHEILASHYGRTSGNPIKATQICLGEIEKQVGDMEVQLVGVTGSGRQVVAAYLGTSGVYNEISAHSLGAAYFDPEVDTIFEIGGQDAKYMYLDNGVPVDYAMNASCSAGTGSFLEESAKCDLGISVYDIQDIALQAKQAIRFQADCAAFINSDIRTALQEGYSKHEIVGGIVYSIVNNYLNKVKGSRPIGNKIFLQGGVAKNIAVAHAFAQVTGRKIIVPPFPELMGAFGIALIAEKKYQLGEIKMMTQGTSLLQLIATKLEHIGHFTCKSCQNYCRIERYAVGDRKFPFGGRCTRYEHIWRKMSETHEKEDLVAYRAEIMYPSAQANESESEDTTSKPKIGIPKALLTHTLYPMYYTFFTELGFEVVLSAIDPNFELIPNAPLCYPMQLNHGAVADLVSKGITTIFLPHILEMKRAKNWFRATFCPVTQTGSYIIAPLFRSAKFLIPEINFNAGYKHSRDLIQMAIEDLNIEEKQAKAAYIKAYQTQEKAERNLQEKGKEALAEAIATNETTIIVIGRSYNVFPKETSQSIPKKLISMGTRVIPFDFLEPEVESDLPWFFANYIKKAVELIKAHNNFFMLYINNFSCTVDAFVQNYARNQMKGKPYLLMELDAHMADAGTQTRLEAFLEIIKNYRVSHHSYPNYEYRPAVVKLTEEGAMVRTSAGKLLAMDDPRVTLHFFPFSPIHTDAMEQFFRVIGLNVAPTGDIKLEYAVEGLKFTSGKECIPLPIILGHIDQILKNRKPGDVTGYFVLTGGEPCVVYSYVQYLEDFLKKNEVTDFFLYLFDQPHDFMGIKISNIVNYGPKAVVLADIIHDIRSSLEVVGTPESIPLLEQYWKEFLAHFTSFAALKPQIDLLIERIASIPRISSPRDHPKVILSGDFYVRFSPFFLQELRELYARHGIIVKSTDLFELFAYGVPFGSVVAPFERDKYVQKMRANFRGEDRIWKSFSPGYYASQLIYKLMGQSDRKLRKRFEKTGLLFAPANDIIDIVRKADSHMSPRIFGEGVLTVGKGMEVLKDGEYDAIILVGPQFCLPYRTSQAILKPIFNEHNFPYLVFDADISAMSPNVRRLIEANIQQIKRRFRPHPKHVEEKESLFKRITGALKGGE